MLTEQTVHKKRSLLAFRSQFDITVTAASAAAADDDTDDDVGSDGSGDDERLSSVFVLLSSICFLTTPCSQSVHKKEIILLIAPSVCGIDDIMRTCKLELDKLDIVINTRKSCWLRIGARNSALCMPLSLITGAIISSVDEIKYLGIFYRALSLFKCSLDHAKKSFYRAANAIVAKVGRIASEEVTLQIIFPATP